MNQKPLDNIQKIIVHSTQHLNTIVLNRPEKRNALDAEMRRKLISLLKSKEFEDKDCLITGIGPCFCAGLDLNEEIDEDVIREFEELLQTISAFGRLKVFVDGIAKGGGAILAASGIELNATAKSVFAMPNPARIDNEYIKNALIFYASKLDFIGQIMQSESLKLNAGKAMQLGFVNIISEKEIPIINQD